MEAYCVLNRGEVWLLMLQFTVRIYAAGSWFKKEEGNIGEKLMEFTKTGGLSSFAWNDFILPQPFLIDRTELWFTVEYTAPEYEGGSIAFDEGPGKPDCNYLRLPDESEEWAEFYWEYEEGDPFVCGNFPIKIETQGTPVPNACWCTTEGEFNGWALGENTATFNTKINPTGLNLGNYSAKVVCLYLRQCKRSCVFRSGYFKCGITICTCHRYY